MNSGFIICGFSCLLFLFFAFIFAVFKGKAAILISGFNTMPKEKRKLYDKEKMSRDYRNAFLIYAAIQGAGAFFAYFSSRNLAIVAYAVWLIVFFKDVHLDEDKAFGKYKRCQQRR